MLELRKIKTKKQKRKNCTFKWNEENYYIIWWQNMKWNECLIIKLLCVLTAAATMNRLNPIVTIDSIDNKKNINVSLCQRVCYTLKKGLKPIDG